MQVFDRVGRVDDFADLRFVGQEGDELGPGVLPEFDDRGVALSPFLGELVEPFSGGLLGGGGVDRSHVAGERVLVVVVGVTEGVADQVDDAGLDDRLRPDGVGGVGEAV